MYYCLEILNDGTSILYQDSRGVVITDNYNDICELAYAVKEEYEEGQGYPVEGINIKRLDTVQTI